MKHAIRIAGLALTAAGLSACASSEERSSYVAPQAVSSSTATVVTDQAYVAYVERQARRRGIDVQWVNMPTKRTQR